MSSTLGDFFIDDIGNFVYAPKVYDMGITYKDVNLGNLNKGYLMIELMPLNDGQKVFAKPENQKWEHQKKYLIDIFKGVDSLLIAGIAMTDLKSGNTLYDPDIRKGSLIDLGGVQKAKDEFELLKFDMSKFSGQFTYKPPEFELFFAADHLLNFQNFKPEFLNNLTEE